jgi:hypothetical protein
MPIGEIPEYVLVALSPAVDQEKDFDFSMADYTVHPDYASSLGIATNSQHTSGFNYDSMSCFINANSSFQSYKRQAIYVEVLVVELRSSKAVVIILLRNINFYRWL